MPFDVTLYNHVNQICADFWSKVAGESSIIYFHRPEFLSVQESILLDRGFKFKYAVITNTKNIHAIIIFQIIDFKISDITGDASFYKSKIGQFINRSIIKVVVCGDLLSSDISGVAFSPETAIVDRTTMLELATKKVLKTLNRDIGILLLKDLPAKSLCLEKLSQMGYHSINLSPTMYIHIPEKWSNLADYKKALKSRYRGSINAAQFDAQMIVRKKLDKLSFEENKHNIERLYRLVYLRSKHKGPYLGQQYFSLMNLMLGENAYDLIGYYEGSSLIGFNTRFYSNEIVDSTFFGMEQEINIKFQLFKNMILDDLEFAIKIGAKSLHLGRTNYQIKSAMGAVAKETISFVKPLNVFSVPLTPLARYFAAPAQWVQHHPFCEAK